MTSYSLYDAGSQLAVQINAAGTAPDITLIVPREYGNTQPALAKKYWVNIEIVL